MSRYSDLHPLDNARAEHTRKKLNLNFEIQLFLSRYLAESNCSTRFCRPLPNRSAKVPKCCSLFAVAKVGIINHSTKCFPKKNSHKYQKTFIFIVPAPITH